MKGISSLSSRATSLQSQLPTFPSLGFFFFKLRTSHTVNKIRGPLSYEFSISEQTFVGFHNSLHVTINPQTVSQAPTEKTVWQTQYSLCNKSRKNWGQGFREIILLDHMVQGHKNTIKAWNSFDLLFTLRNGQEIRHQTARIWSNPLQFTDKEFSLNEVLPHSAAEKAGH